MPAQLPIFPNLNPYTSSQVFKKSVTFFTQDEITGQSIIEGYNVNGPVNTTIMVIPLAGGTKFVVPLTSDSTSPGAPFLKFHFPNGTAANKMYVTFAVKNARMADGYYDYKTGIPSDYRSKLKYFIIAGLGLTSTQILALNGPKEKAIRFTTYGSSTNKPAEAVTFYVTFKAVFTAATDVASTGTAVLATGAAPPPTGTSGGGIAVSGFPGLTAFNPRIG